MKIVLYNKEDKRVMEIIENITNPVVNGIKITWDGGMLDGLRCGFMIVEDDTEIGETIIEEELQKTIEINLKNVNEIVSQAIQSEFTSKITGHSYHTEIHDQLYFQRNLTFLSNNPDVETIEHKNSSGEIIIHNREEYFGLFEELNQHINSYVQRGWELKESIRSAKSIEELKEINIEIS